MVSWGRTVGFLFFGVAAACAAPAAPSTSDDDLTASTTSVEPKNTQSATVAPPKTLAPAKKFDCGPAPGAERSDQVCWRWYCDGNGSATTAWNGNPATCSAGDLDATSADQALRRINVHRFLADLPPFTHEPAWTAAAQECALIAHANEKLSHEPPRDWACWNDTGAKISEGSLVANVAIAPSIAAYIEDPGNEPTMVHRRWLLDESLASVGFGSTDHYSCVVVNGRSVSKPTAPKPTHPRGWTAWPPAGPVPFDVFETEKLDTAGWTVQSTKDDLVDATVKVSLDGKDLPVMATHLTDGQGSRTAIRFVPQGWQTEAGRSYAVTVTGSAARLEFAVNPIACVHGSP